VLSPLMYLCWNGKGRGARVFQRINYIICTEQVHPSAEELKVGDTVEVRLYAKNTQIVQDFSSVFD
jgi:hypothetical protein